MAATGTTTTASTHQWRLTMMRQAALLLVLLGGTCGMPVQINIPFRGKECLYDYMDQGYVFKCNICMASIFLCFFTSHFPLNCVCVF